jgi:hypothetical protein
MLTIVLQQTLVRAVETETKRLYDLDAAGLRLLNQRALEPSGMSETEQTDPPCQSDGTGG